MFYGVNNLVNILFFLLFVYVICYRAFLEPVKLTQNTVVPQLSMQVSVLLMYF